jgi:serine/threonine protein kinase
MKELVRQSSSCQLYRAEDVFRGDLHLVLRPSTRLLSREGWRQWFRQYSETALAVLPHPHVLACERMTEEGEFPFLVMENVEGQCWDTLIGEGKLRDLRTMLALARQVAEGLGWLHSQTIIHGNLKPANVLVSTEWQAKVWKYAEPDAKTRAYASPEQLGEGPLTAATDAWSWAVSVLHMFVGRVAWARGPEATTALQRYMQRGPALADLPLMPGTVADLLRECFEEDPEGRLTDMEQVAARIEKICRSAFRPAAGETQHEPAAEEAGRDGVAGESPARWFDARSDRRRPGGRRRY